MWSKKYHKCIICETTKIKYEGKGMCKKCYSKEYCKRNFEKIKKYRQKYYKKNCKKEIECSQKWQKENFEKAKKNCKEYYKKNSEKIKESARKYRKRNPEKIKKDSKKYREENSDYFKKYNKKYGEENLAKRREYEYNKKQKDPRFKLKCNISTAINNCLKKKLLSKSGKSTFDFLPYTVDELKQHLEKQFEPWMNWNNWGIGNGKWNIDHIIPNSSFNYISINDIEFQKCWALNNLRPLDAIENIRKGNKIIY